MKLIRLFSPLCIAALFLTSCASFVFVDPDQPPESETNAVTLLTNAGFSITQQINFTAIATNPVPLKLIAPDKPLQIEATDPFTLKIDTNGVIHAHVTSDPIRVELTNAVINLNLSNLPGTITPSQFNAGPNPLQVIVCCCTNENGRIKTDPDGNVPPPFNVKIGPQWWLPLLCIVLGGALGRWLFTYLGLASGFEDYVRARDELKKWLEIHVKELPEALLKEGSLKSDLKKLLDEELIGSRFDLRKEKCAVNLKALREIFEDGYTKISMPKELENYLNRLNATCEDGLDTVKNLTAGVVAAALSPVFLRLISSNLLVAATNDWFSVLTFFSFCLFAGMLGLEFIRTVVKLFHLSVKLAEKKMNDIPKKENA
jgi:hypothetical protein